MNSYISLSMQVFDEEKQLQLKKHLLKTQCTELVNELVLYLADDSLIDIAQNKDITPEVSRSKLEVKNKKNFRDNIAESFALFLYI